MTRDIYAVPIYRWQFDNGGSRPCDLLVQTIMVEADSPASAVTGALNCRARIPHTYAMQGNVRLAPAEVPRT